MRAITMGEDRFSGICVQGQCDSPRVSYRALRAVEGEPRAPPLGRLGQGHKGRGKGRKE